MRNASFLFLSAFVLFFFLSVEDSQALVTVCASGCNTTDINNGLVIAAANEEVRITDSGYYQGLISVSSSDFLTSNATPAPTIWRSSGTGAPSGNPAMSVSGSNIVVRGVRVFWNGSSCCPAALVISGTNVTVENSTIDGSTWYGVYVNSPDRLNFVNNTVVQSQFGSYGAYWGGSNAGATQHNSNISGNVISGVAANSFGMGISGQNNTIGKNVLYSGSYQLSGIYLNGSTTSNNSIFNNTFNFIGESNNVAVSLHYTGTGNRIFNNTINVDLVTGSTRTTPRGVQLSGSNQTLVADNFIDIFSNYPYGPIDGYGVYLDSASNNNVSGNTVYSSGATQPSQSMQSRASAAYVYLSDNNTFHRNHLQSNGTGLSHAVYLYNSSNNLFTNNTIFTNVTESYAVLSEYSRNNTFRDSVINSTLSRDVTVGYGNGTTYLVNVSMNLSDINISTSQTTDKVIVQYPADIRVTNSTGSSVVGALVTGSDSTSVSDSENPTSSFSGTTNSSGYIDRQLLNHFIVNATYNMSSGYLYFTNYNVSVQKLGYRNTSSSFGLGGYQFVSVAMTLLSPSGIFGKGPAFYEISYDPINSKVHATVNSTNTSYPLQSGWSHVVMTFDSGSVVLYVNGQQVGSASASAGQSTRSMILGNDTDLRVDELRLYSRAISATEVQNHYIIGSALKATIQAIGSGSLGRYFNVSVVTGDGSFSRRSDSGVEMVAGSTGTVRVENVTGAPSDVLVSSNACGGQMRSIEAQLKGVYC